MAVIRNGKYYKNGKAAPVVVSEGHKRWNIDEQRRAHSADILQRYVGGKPNGEWIRTYPEEAKAQFTPDEIRKYANDY